MRCEHYNPTQFFLNCWHALVHLIFVHVELQRTSTPSHRPKLSLELLEKHVLEGHAVFSKLLNAFVELVKSHLVLKELPAEFGFIVNVRNLVNVISLCGGLYAEPPRDSIRTVPQLLEERGRDGKEVHACKCFDLANLQEICGKSVRNAYGKGRQCESTPTLRNDAPITMVL